MKETVHIRFKALDATGDLVSLTLEGSPETIEQMLTIEAGNLVAAGIDKALTERKGKAN